MDQTTNDTIEANLIPSRKRVIKGLEIWNRLVKICSNRGIFSLTRLKDIGLTQNMNMVNGFYKRDTYSSYVTIMVENKRNTFYQSGNAEFSLVWWRIIFTKCLVYIKLHSKIPDFNRLISRQGSLSDNLKASTDFRLYCGGDKSFVGILEKLAALNDSKNSHENICR